MEAASVLFAILVVGAILVEVIIIESGDRHYSSTRGVLEHWAEKNGYHILSSEPRSFRRGPFFWTTSERQEVYYVSVETSQGEVRSGWVRCGGWLWGLFSDYADVRWDD